MSKAVLKERLHNHLENRGINPLESRDDLPVGLVHEKVVPLRGSVHIASGHTISRELIEKLFKKVKFC